MSLAPGLLLAGRSCLLLSCQQHCSSPHPVSHADAVRAVTLDHLITDEPEMVILVGDLTYADDHLLVRFRRGPALLLLRLAWR